MNKVLIFCYLLSSTLSILCMEQKQSPELFGFAMRNLDQMPPVALAMVQNSLAQKADIYSKRALLRYFRKYQEKIPQCFNSSIMPLAAIQYIGEAANRLMHQPYCFTVGLCHIGYTNDGFNCCGWSKKALIELYNFTGKFRSDRDDINGTGNQVTISCCHFEETLLDGIHQTLTNTVKPYVTKQWQEILKADKIPYVILACRPNLKAHIILHASPSMVIVRRDFPIKLPKDFVLISPNPHDNAFEQIMGDNDTFAVETIEEALNNIEAYELSRKS